MGFPYFDMEFITRFPYSEMELSTIFPRYFRVISAISAIYLMKKKPFQIQENPFLDRRNRGNRENSAENLRKVAFQNKELY